MQGRKADSAPDNSDLIYFDCFAGVSGNMVVGGFIDLGLPITKLEEGLEKLGLKGYRLKVETRCISHIRGTSFEVVLDHAPPVERSFGQIRSLISESSLDQPVKETSVRIFSRLAEAESRIHGQHPEDVHFHELGAIDTIIDIVGTSIGVAYFGIDAFYSSPLPLSKGWTESGHGRLPLPAPATLELLQGIPVYAIDADIEAVTPTGAAIISTLAKGFGPIPSMTLGKTGYGAGQYILPGIPNLLRLMTGHAASVPEAKPVTVIECHIDDMNPEFYDFVMEKLFEAGALDVSLAPIHMKKNRPGTMLRVLGPKGMESFFAEIIFRETTTLGVRYYGVERLALQRETAQVQTEWGPVKAKMITGVNGRKTLYPEYRECREIAVKFQVPLKDVYEKVTAAGKSSC
ncbi:MAG: nickel pincer cofactor biosynthesis protein LarC [Pseudomonadota bacterium]